MNLQTQDPSSHLSTYLLLLCTSFNPFLFGFEPYQRLWPLSYVQQVFIRCNSSHTPESRPPSQWPRPFGDKKYATNAVKYFLWAKNEQFTFYLAINFCHTFLLHPEKPVIWTISSVSGVSGPGQGPGGQFAAKCLYLSFVTAPQQSICLTQRHNAGEQWKEGVGPELTKVQSKL